MLLFIVVKRNKDKKVVDIMSSGKAFIFGVVSYYIFTGVFGMSFLGSFILSLICTAIITDIVIASNKSDDKEKMIMMRTMVHSHKYLHAYNHSSVCS